MSVTTAVLLLCVAAQAVCVVVLLRAIRKVGAAVQGMQEARERPITQVPWVAVGGVPTQQEAAQNMVRLAKALSFTSKNVSTSDSATGPKPPTAPPRRSM